MIRFLLRKTINIASSHFAQKLAVKAVKYSWSLLNKSIKDIKDDDLEGACRHSLNWALKNFPEADESKIVQKAVRRAQVLTPDVIMSDSDVEQLIERIYNDFKNGRADI